MTMTIAPSSSSPIRATARQQRRVAATARPPVSAAPEHAPLVLLEDQRQLWLTHGDKPLRFEDAMQLVLAEREADGARTDQLADLRGWSFGAVEGVAAIQQVVGLDLAAGDASPVRLRKRAFAGLCKLVGVEPTFIGALPAQLAAVNMNWLMAHGQSAEQGTRFLRRAGGDLRSIHSDRYGVCDDDVLLDIVDGVLAKAGLRADAMVRASCVGPQMTLRITVPNEGVEVKRGDVIEWGLDVGNSEVGLRSVQITPATYRLVCLNGMRSSEQGARTRIRHVGDHQAIREDLEVAIPAAFAEARGDITRWQKSVDRMVFDALDDLESLRGFGLNQGEVRSIGRTLIDAPEYMPNDELQEQLRSRRTTVYDVANAMTATARERSDVTSRLALEETAHRYLTRRTA